MNLKLNNQLSHLPNEISISRYEKHQRYLELFLSQPEDKYAFCPACKSYSCIKKGHSSVKTVYHIPIGTSSTFLTFVLQRFRCKDCGKYFTEYMRLLCYSKKLAICLSFLEYLRKRVIIVGA